MAKAFFSSYTRGILLQSDDHVRVKKGEMINEIYPNQHNFDFTHDDAVGSASSSHVYGF